MRDGDAQEEEKESGPRGRRVSSARARAHETRIMLRSDVVRGLVSRIDRSIEFSK